MNRDDQKFVQTMLEKAKNKDKTEAQKKNDVDISQIENITRNIKEKIQRS